MSHVSISNAILCVLLSCSLGLRDDDQHVIELGVNNFHKDQATRVESKAEQLASSAPATEVQGDIETALLLAKAQLEDELAKQHKKKVNEEREIGKYRQDLKNAQSIVDAWKCKYIGFIMDWVYQNYCSHLRDKQVPFLKGQLDSSVKELGDIVSLIARLQGEVHKKHGASEAARLEEGLIASLSLEEQTLQNKKETSLLANANMEEVEKKKDDTKIAAFDKELEDLAEVLKSTEEEHARLTEEHTGGYCVDKEAKGERVCERCDDDEENDQQKACGDTCISAGQHCWYDAGCSCMEKPGEGSIAARNRPAGGQTSDRPPSFLQVTSESGQSHAHPLREKLNEAKAQLRKIMKAQDGKIDNLNAQLETSNNDIATAENAKAAAEQKFTAEIAQQKETQSRLMTAQQAAKTEKAAQKATLETTTQDGEQEIQELVFKLEGDIKKLKDGLVETEHEKTDSMEANAASMTVLKDKNAAQINDIVVEIQKILNEKDDAQKRLDAIESQHELEDHLAAINGAQGPASAGLA